MGHVIQGNSPIMEELLSKSDGPRLFSPGEFVEGKVLFVTKSRIVVELEGANTGLITGRELHDASDTVKELSEGDEVSAYVIDGEDKDGLVILSLRKASQEKTWRKFVDAYKNNEVIEVKACEANKGGLLLDVDGIKGFIPVSQLAPLHYPRVDGADAAEILRRLQALIGETFKVKIINIDSNNGKLILSEKAAFSAEREESLYKLQPGDVVTGRISGIVKFGIFVAFDGLEGLVHISEIAWGHVSNPSNYGKLGDEVKVKILGVEDDKISLSIKRLTEDPWIRAAKKYQIGDIVEGEVNRVTPFGAFLELEADVNGLIHVSEIQDGKLRDATKALNKGDYVRAKVIAIEPDERRIGLSIKALVEEESSTRVAMPEIPSDDKAASQETEEASVEVEKPVKKKASKKKKEEIAEEEDTSNDEATE